jgi:DNA-binding response OmpR family regulator
MAETILIVEDEPEFAALVELWMGNAGYATVVARTGPDALRRFYDDHPDLVILDVALPGLDGWRIIERIREFSRIPILMVTAHSSEADKIRGLKLGADDYMTKPLRRRPPIGRGGSPIAISSSTSMTTASGSAGRTSA